MTDQQLTRSTIVFSVVCVLIAAAALALVYFRDGAGTDSNRGLAATDSTMQRLARASVVLRDPQSAKPQATAGQNTQVASVASLIGGLEKRLEAKPDDASGWALLAQSYAFTGQTDQAEAAVKRAVALGFDEADLRQRVDGARRDPHRGLAGLQSSNR